MRVSYQQVYLAEKNCSKSKRKGAGCQRFEANLVDNLFEIQQALQSKTYVPKPMNVFVADNGSKPREIYAPHYYDRVIHHILVPKLDKIISHKFIYDSTANQKNKGTHFAVARLQKMMRKSSLRGGTTRQSPASSVVPNRLLQSCLLRNDSDFDADNDECDLTQKNKTYYLQLDIHNFFYSVDKKILMQMLVKHIKVAIKQKKITSDTGRDYYWLCQQILKRNNKTQIIHNVKLPFIKQLHNIDSDKGLPIGNLTSQFFGNVYLNELDQFVKHQLKVKNYIRYVDDFVLLSDNPQQLEKWQTHIQKFLDEKLSLRLKEVAKPKDIAQGVDFLGYIIRPHYNLVRRRILGNMHQRLALWYKENSQKVCNGSVLHLPKAASDKIDSVIASYLGHFKHAKSHKITQQKFSQFKWLDLLFYYHNDKYKSKRHTKKGKKLMQQWSYFKFHYQPFVLLMKVGCYFVVLKQAIESFFFDRHSQVKHRNQNRQPSLRGRMTWQSHKSTIMLNRLPQSPLLRNDEIGLTRKVGPAHHLCFVDSSSYHYDGRGSSYLFFDRIFKQSKLKPNWIEFHQKKLSLVLKSLQQQSISYVVATQQGYVNNKLRKRKISQIYISNYLNPKEAI